jgi:hypothetical protein
MHVYVNVYVCTVKKVHQGGWGVAAAAMRTVRLRVACLVSGPFLTSVYVPFFNNNRRGLVFIALKEKGTETKKTAQLDMKGARKVRSETNRKAHHRGKQRHRTSSIMLKMGRLQLHCNSTKVTPIMSRRSHLPRDYSPSSTTPEREDITEGRRHVPLRS